MDVGARVPKWSLAPETDVPEWSGHLALKFEMPREMNTGTYAKPEEPKNANRTPEPTAGPTETTLGDGSAVTYAWCQLADQPAMQNADVAPAEREETRRRVELLIAIEQGTGRTSRRRRRAR